MSFYDYDIENINKIKLILDLYKANDEHDINFIKFNINKLINEMKIESRKSSDIAINQSIIIDRLSSNSEYIKFINEENINYLAILFENYSKYIHFNNFNTFHKSLYFCESIKDRFINYNK